MNVSFRSKKKVVTDYFVYVDKVRFDFFDTLAVLRHTEDRRYPIAIIDDEMIRVFKANEIIEYEGSRRPEIGARLGKNGKKFIAILEDKEKKIYDKLKKGKRK